MNESKYRNSARSRASIFQRLVMWCCFQVIMFYPNPCPENKVFYWVLVQAGCHAHGDVMAMGRKLKLLSYYNKGGIIEFGIFGFGIRAKDTSRNVYIGNHNEVFHLGSWVFLFGRVS